ncbi:EamA family transporter [Pelistega europaea]|uniref:EamA family transporter n=1 Tax=Pelistega europaea TaxID=106147 RepID=A0A7Y4P6Q9_9BURK|nr:EamA family transporter [Pelistega europaea]NOL50174.1 EamA family transporter [Pelistega europaea]
MFSKQVTKGFIFGCLGSCFYGLNPLFGLPLYQLGLDPDSVLFCRFSVACAILAVLMQVQKIPFSLTKAEFVSFIFVGGMFAISSLSLFMSYQLIEAGIASTILFIYPLLVAVIMMIFFKEHLNFITMFSITLVILGVSMLYRGGNGTTLNPFGVWLVFISALTYAIYIVAVEKSPLRNVPIIKLTFYSLLCSATVFFVRLDFGTQLQLPYSSSLLINVIGLAVIPTVLSLVLMNQSIQMIGSTTASIIGALEPITALLVGVFVFHEHMTIRIFVGIFMILSAIVLTISGKEILRYINSHYHHFRH